MATMRVVGQRAGRAEGPEVVTGQGKYAMDAVLPGTLWCKILRSPFAHARVIRTDVSKALRLPGVHAVLTGEDVRDLRTGNFYQDEPLLVSWDRVRFIGDKVAAVAAEDEDIAQQALDFIEVGYEELPAVFDPREATQSGSPLLHPEFNNCRRVLPLESPSNVCGHMQHVRGDMKEGFAQADVVVEGSYQIPRAHQACLEPHSCLVWIDPEGRVQVWASSQAPVPARNDLARIAGLPRDKVVFNVVRIGGSFGGKGDATGAALCYFLAKETGHPVKLVLDYSEELMAMDPRHASEIHIRAGVKRDGTTTAWEAEAYFATGAYTAYAPVPPLGGLLVTEMVNAYRIPNVRIDSYQVYTNTVPCGYFRGPGSLQGTFAAESHIDTIARRIGMDPYDLRMRNIIRTGAEAHVGGAWTPVLQPDAPEYQEVRLEETLRAAIDASGYYEAKQANIGRASPFTRRARLGSRATSRSISTRMGRSWPTTQCSSHGPGRTPSWPRWWPRSCRSPSSAFAWSLGPLPRGSPTGASGDNAGRA